jgi:ATP-dependent DNA ligase
VRSAVTRSCSSVQDLGVEIRDELRVRGVILDGEVLALDPEGHEDFMLLMRGEGNLHYAAFDLLWLNGRDLRAKPLTDRKRRLERLIRATTPVLSRVLSVPTEASLSLRRHSDWTWRGSWPSGKPIHMRSGWPVNLGRNLEPNC